MLNNNEIERRLSDYGDFLLKRSLVASGKETFFIHWVRKYLSKEASFKGVKWKEKLPQFLDKLATDPKVADWQIDQADQAIRLYFLNFYTSDQSVTVKDDSSQMDAPDVFDGAQALADLREWMRIKHYAYKTEQAYLNWCKRFFTYSVQCKRSKRGQSKIKITVVSSS